MNRSKACLSSQDFTFIQNETGITLGTDEQNAINFAIKPLVSRSPWEDRKYIKKRREAAKSISRYLTKIDKFIVEIMMIDDADDSEACLPEIREMRAFFDEEVRSFRVTGRPKKMMLPDVLKNLRSIYERAGGTQWRVWKSDRRQSKFIDFVSTIFQCAKIEYQSYEALCAFWQDVYRGDQAFATTKIIRSVKKGSSIKHGRASDPGSTEPTNSVVTSKRVK